MVQRIACPAEDSFLRKEMIDHELYVPVSESPHQIERVAYLAVETRCWLIKEQEQLRLRSQLHTDGEQLALFNVQTFAWNTNDCICEVCHVQHLDHLLDVIVFFLLANRFGLAKHSREAKGLAHRGGFQMKIPILDQ
jgi:hypothetical protein